MPRCIEPETGVWRWHATMTDSAMSTSRLVRFNWNLARSMGIVCCMAVAGGPGACAADRSVAAAPAASAAAPAGSVESRLREVFRQGISQRGEIVLRPGDPQRLVTLGAPVPVRAASAPAAAAQAASPSTAPEPARSSTARAVLPAGAASGPAPGAGRAGQPVAERSAPVTPGVAAAVATSGAKSATPPPVAASAAGPRARQTVAWGYGPDNGPLQWARLSPDFALCGSGRQQSPIDIVDPVHVEMAPLGVDYQQTAYRVQATEHTLELGLEPGSELSLRGRRYALQGLRFHRPGEMRVRGVAAEMALYLMHTDAQGHQVVVSVNLVRGAAMPFLEQIWGDIPTDRAGAQLSARSINPALFLPKRRSYQLFTGSLTTPPCTEDVTWLHMVDPVTLSAGQLAVFTQLYPSNARSVQPSHGRLVKQSD